MCEVLVSGPRFGSIKFRQVKTTLAGHQKSSCTPGCDASTVAVYVSTLPWLNIGENTLQSVLVAQDERRP